MRLALCDLTNFLQHNIVYIDHHTISYKVLTTIGNSDIQLCKMNVTLLVNKNSSVPIKDIATLINSKDLFTKLHPYSGAFLPIQSYV